MRLNVVDANGDHLPGAVVDYYWDGHQAKIEVGDFDPDIAVPKGAKDVKFIGHYPNAKDVTVTAKATDSSPILQFKDVVRPSEAPIGLAVTAGLILAATCALAFFSQVIGAFAFGVIFITSMIVLAFKYPHPTPIQYLVMRIVLALSSAGIAGIFTGFIAVNIPGIGVAAQPIVTAGGALAVFAVVYFKSPAALVAEPKDAG